MQFKTMVLAASLALTMAGGASAKVVECTTPEKGWVSNQFIFGYDAGASTATIYDPVIHHFVGEPIQGKVEETAKKTVFNWSVMVQIRGAQTKMSYRASFFPANGQFTVRATPGAGYVENFEGRGTCVVKEK
jgi:hypothetical protein